MSRTFASTPETDPRGAEAAIWAARLAEGPLSVDDQLQFQAWVDADPENLAAMDGVVGAWRVVEDYATAPELLELRKRALGSAQKAHRRRLSRIAARESWPWTALAAAVLLAAVTAGAWTWFMPRTYTTELGERRVVSLSDGSKISLDAETVVRVRYALGRRQLWLDHGRAKFDVAKDPLHPFTVDAAGREVVAVGTSFSVELVNHQVRVVLYEGHVAVLDQGRAGRSRSVVVARPSRTPAEQVLTPGHELVTAARDPQGAAAAPIAEVAPVDPVRSLSWEAGQLVFEDEPLSTAVERINRYAATPIVLGDNRVGAVRISGVVGAGDTDAFVQGLTTTFPVQARMEDNRVVLSADLARKNFKR